MIRRGVQTVGYGAQFFHAAALTAEGQVRDKTRCSKQLHSPSTEGLRRSGGERGGQFQYQIGAPHERQPGAGPLVGNGTVGLLHPVAAHNGNDGGVFPKVSTAFGYLIAVTCMKRVVFRNNSDDIHAVTSESEKLWQTLFTKGKQLW